MTEDQLKQAIAHLLTTVKPRMVNGDRAQIAIKDPDFTGRFEEFLDQYEVRQPMLSAFNLEAGEYPLIVNYDLSHDDMIVAGHCRWKNPNITADRFPIKGKGKVEFESTLFNFGNSISANDVIAIIRSTDKENPWEEGKLEHLLAFGAAYPEVQRKFPIIALGSVGRVSGGLLVPYLDGGGAGRDLHVNWFDDAWNSHYRFLAVRKKVPQS